MKPIAITLGDPAGIGPDIIIMLAQSQKLDDVLVIANKDLLQQRAQQLQCPITLIDYQQGMVTANQQLLVHDIPLTAPVTCGVSQSCHAQYMLDCIDVATAGCLMELFSALVTGPVNKATINQAGIAFTGHTEYLAKITQTDRVVMMLVADKLRVALATTHLPLAKVSEAINAEDLELTLTIIDKAFREQLHIGQPKIKVCGLNPHAGEQGHLGKEEIDIITPVINNCQKAGIDCLGPYPADTLFTPKHLVDTDVVLAMYHDQGLPVLKYAGFGHAVNITLGLPIIRTSVDHGTALDIAGTGNADPGSLTAALQLARDIAQHDQS